MDVEADDLENAEDFVLQTDVVGEAESSAQAETELRTQDAAEIFIEFMEVAIHQILYTRKLYPEESFLDRKKYSIPIHISCHPGLRNYITAALTSLKSVLAENRICHISILIKDGCQPLENFLFEVNLLRKAVREQEYAELEQSLRAFLLSLMSSSSTITDPQNQTSSFEILVGCNSDCEVDLNVTEEVNQMKWAKVDEADYKPPMRPERLIPMKAMTDSSLLSMQLILERMKPENTATTQ